MFRKFETVLNTVSALAVAALCLLIAVNVLSRSLLGVGVHQLSQPTGQLSLFPFADE